MKRTLGLLGASAIVGLGVLALTTPAQAETTTDCKTVTVLGRSGPDSGENGNNWATTTITRKLEVCATGKPETGDWTYKATVADTGTFVTSAGESPGIALFTLKGGFTGKVVGGFSATFDAPKWVDTFTLTAPTKSTPTGDWVKTAFGGTPKFDSKGPVAGWGWTYTNTTCSGDGQKWVNAETGNSGDITEKACAVVTPPKPTTKKCEAYVYYGSTVTLCDRFANVTGKLKCSQVAYKVKLVNANNDPWGLDGGGDNVGVKGVGCESYPVRIFTTPSPSHTTPSPTHTTTPPAATGGLPVTGDKAGKIAAIGGAAVVIGAIAAVVARRRKAKFVA